MLLTGSVFSACLPLSSRDYYLSDDTAYGELNSPTSTIIQDNAPTGLPTDKYGKGIFSALS